ncbi:MAG TPA: translation factor GTPase family protein, partial [Micromonosporaceae bacterium]|nr:translation factor GTPase family protein [Micromonosporaceae bacterium]
MRTLNLGILAHVDAGKTSLTERLLYSAGVIDEIGNVDDGNTQTDTMALERRRGITIKSAVVSFAIDGVTVNLIDTPGHPDFIAEVERVLSVLDGAVLVISAVEGVQPQTRVLMRALRRLHLPTLIFVNKIDRRGAAGERLVPAMAEKLAGRFVPMGRVGDAGERGARFVPYGSDDPSFRAALIDRLADDEAFLRAYVDDESTMSFERLRAELAAQTKNARVHPVFFGSAITGAGIDELVDGLTELLAASDGADNGAASGNGGADPASGLVFKVERGPAGEKIAYVRMFSGTIQVRDRVPSSTEKITAIGVFEHGSALAGASLVAGQIGKVWGLGDVRVGDWIGAPRPPAPYQHFSPPTLETVVAARDPGDRAALHVALSQLAEQDPLINLRQDDRRHEVFVSLYGEVQKEVIQATLADDFGVDATFRETTTICIERPVGVGTAVETIATEPNPFLATVGLRVEPQPVGSGVDFRLGVELGSLPLAFINAIEQAVRETLGQGLRGWPVVDCAVTLIRSGYWARQSHAHGTFDASMSSTAGDFRNLTPLVLMAALVGAGTVVCEPVHRFRLDVPADLVGSAMPALVRLGAIPLSSV